MKKTIFLTVFLFSLTSSFFTQHTAKLDSSFLTIGEFWDGYLNQYHSIISSAALPDSTLVYVAQITAGSGPSAMIKLKNDGTIDSTFGTNGKMTYTINGSAPTVKEIKLFNGKLYLSGKVGRDKFVTRINTNGTIDNTFGISGSRTINYSTPIVDITNSFAMDTSGNSYIGARFTNLTTSTTELSVTKINSSGNVVTSFGSSGRASFILPTGAVSALSDLAIDASQRIIAAACGSNTGNNVVLIVKFNQNGTLYTGFNSTGYKEWTFSGADTYQVATNEILADNDKIIVAGEYLVSGSPNAFVFKLKPNGDYDSTFANNGTLLYQNGSLDITFSDAAFSPNKNIIISGSAGYGTGSHISLLKIKPNGVIDSTFATNGMFLNQVGTRWEKNVAECLSVYQDGRVFLGGNSSDCDQTLCYFTSSMSRVRFDDYIDPGTGGDTTLNDTTSHTSITELNLLEDLKIHPNPTHTGENINFSSNQNIDRIEIYSTNGSKVFEKNNPSNFVKLPSNLNTGIYLIHFYSMNTRAVRKIIIN